MSNELMKQEIESEFIIRIEQFQRVLNRQPETTKKDQKKGIIYISISEIETQLDKLFMGHWQTRNLQMMVVGNELVATIELGVLHPVSKEWIWRSGAGACMIRQTSGAKISDIDSKIKNAVEMDAPHAKAQAVKNAALSLGDFFGRNIRRKSEDVSTYTPIYTPKIQKRNEKKEA